MNLRDVTAPWMKSASAVLLVLAVLLAYGNTLKVPFVFDDRPAILENASIRDLSALGTVLTPPADGRAVAGRPVVNLSLAFNYAWSGTDVWSYHALNLSVHAMAGLLLLGIVRRTLLKRIRTAEGSHTAGQQEALLVGMAVAMLWVLHPLQTESVTCIIQRTESLCGLFYLATLYAFIRGAELHVRLSSADRESGKRAAPWYAVSVATCLLGMGTKEVMVTAPLMVLLYDRTFSAGSFREALRERRRYYLALAGTWLLLAWLVLGGGGARGEAAGFGVGMSPWSYALKQCEALVVYLKLSVWPHPLVLDYGTATPGSLAEVGWQALVVLALVGATGWAFVRKPALGFLGAWVLVILAPSSSVVPLAAQTMAEHRMYLPLAAVLVLVVLGVHSLGGLRSRILLLLLFLGAGVLTWQRNEEFGSELRLWSETAKYQPGNSRVLVNLGNALLEADKLPEALATYERAEQLNQKAPEIQSNLCLVTLRLERLPEAIEHGRAALRLDPSHAEAKINLAQALMRSGQQLLRKGDLEEARREVTEAAQLDPGNAEAQFLLGNVNVRAEDFPAAIAAFRRAVELAPTFVPARNNLANALFVGGRLDEAIAEYHEVLRQQPENASVKENLQRALEQKAAR